MKEKIKKPNPIKVKGWECDWCGDFHTNRKDAWECCNDFNVPYEEEGSL